MKTLIPKHPLLAKNRKPSSMNRFVKWVPFSRSWARLKTLGIHSPTWATAMALSAVLIGESNSSRFSWGEIEIMVNPSPSQSAESSHS